MWSEEELRDIPELEPDPDPEPPPPRLLPRSRATALRQSLARLNADTPHPHEKTRSSVVFTPGQRSHGNFADLAYARILARPAWAARLTKVHTSRRKARPTGPEETTHAWHELDTATSSDALLMNIFCYPRVLATPRLPALLGVDPGLEPIFGFHPQIPRARQLKDRTEVDMQLGNLLVEAKLTEANFQTAPLSLLERYTAFTSVFDPDLLPRQGPAVASYQLLRGVLAAHHHQCRFAVFVDAHRPELIHSWLAVIRAVRSYDLQSRLRLLTWQEIAATLPAPLQLFLANKYGIG